jgi:hypothetical protein
MNMVFRCWRGQPLDGKRILAAIPLKQKALAEYWGATTPDQERVAYAKMREIGFPPAYGEKS